MMMVGRYNEYSYVGILGTEGGVCGVVCSHGDAEGELCAEFGVGGECGGGYGVVCSGGERVGWTVGARHFPYVLAGR
jgi:hypothetical protein